MFVCTLLVGVWAQLAPVGWSFLLLHVVGAVFVLRSQPGISRLEGRVVTGRLFVVLPRLPFTSTRFQSWVICLTPLPVSYSFQTCTKALGTRCL